MNSLTQANPTTEGKKTFTKQLLTLVEKEMQDLKTNAIRHYNSNPMAAAQATLDRFHYKVSKTKWWRQHATVFYKNL